MEIEPSFIKNGIICKNVFGRIKMRYKDSHDGWIDYKLITNKAIKLHYDSKTEIYSLFVPIEVETVKNDIKEDSFIGIDPGVRTFMICITKDKAIKFGTNMFKKIKDLINKIDKINENNEYNQEIKNKLTAKYYRKITNLVDEMQWKVINYLTNNYERIYIGKLNMKDVVSNEKSNISKMTKRMGIFMKHCQFRQRLIYKCKSKQIKCIEVNEYCTSKTCSVCGEYKKDLKGEEVYECDNCGSELDRDINASRCITIKNTK
jgi:transposase